MSVLSVTALNQFYGGSHTLWDVTLDVPAGSRTCLMGRNGMGKTTTVRSIMGLTPASAGSIRLDGREIRALPSYRVAKLGVGLVPEGRQVPMAGVTWVSMLPTHRRRGGLTKMMRHQLDTLHETGAEPVAGLTASGSTTRS